tara:strand:+ start:546 stop:737 length:192 start_codon:yes stop_codon:yes gene_type:complete
MISLVTAGLMDTSFLIPLQVFQTYIMVLAKASWVATHAPIRIAWDPVLEGFVPFGTMTAEVLS